MLGQYSITNLRKINYINIVIILKADRANIALKADIFTAQKDAFRGKESLIDIKYDVCMKIQLLRVKIGDVLFMIGNYLKYDLNIQFQNYKSRQILNEI